MRVRLACNYLCHDASTSCVALDPQIWNIDPQLWNIVPNKLSEHDDDDELSPNLKNFKETHLSDAE